jgi:hypothetical protein
MTFLGQSVASRRACCPISLRIHVNSTCPIMHQGSRQRRNGSEALKLLCRHFKLIPAYSALSRRHWVPSGFCVAQHRITIAVLVSPANLSISSWVVRLALYGHFVVSVTYVRLDVLLGRVEQLRLSSDSDWAE